MEDVEVVDEDDESSDPEEDVLEDVESEATEESDCVLPDAELVPEEAVWSAEEVVSEEPESEEEAEASVPDEPD